MRAGQFVLSMGVRAPRDPIHVQERDVAPTVPASAFTDRRGCC